MTDIPATVEAAVSKALASPQENAEPPNAYQQAAQRWRERGDQLVRDAEHAREELYKYADGLLDSNQKVEEFYNREKAYITEVFDHIHEAPKRAKTGNSGHE